MKTVKMNLNSIKLSDGWTSLAYDLKFEQFEKEHPLLDKEEDLPDLFYTEVISKHFEYGEFADLEIVVDENFNIVGGRILPQEKK